MFMILTYIVEFDKVHYPLSLSKVNSGSDKSHLLGVIDNLKKELAMYKSQTTNQKSMISPMLDVSMSRSHAPTQNYGHAIGGIGEANQLYSPNLDSIKKIDSRYAFAGGDHMSVHQQAPVYQMEQQSSVSHESHRAAMEMAQQKIKLLESKIQAMEGKQAKETIKLQEEHASEMRVVLKHTEELEAKIFELEEEAAQWRTVAEERREAGGKDKERALQREIEGLKRRVNEVTSNEKLLRAQLKEARETIDNERKKFGVSKKALSREKVRIGSPWKKPVSRSVSLDRDRSVGSNKKPVRQRTPTPKKALTSTLQSKTRMSPKIPSKLKSSGYGPEKPFARRRDSNEMMPRRRKSSGSLNTSQVSNGSRGSNKSSKLSSSSKNKHLRDDSIEIRRKRLHQKKPQTKDPVGPMAKSKPVDEVRKLDDEIEEIDAKFNRLKNLMNMTGANATFSKP